MRETTTLKTGIGEIEVPEDWMSHFEPNGNPYDNPIHVFTLLNDITAGNRPISTEFLQSNFASSAKIDPRPFVTETNPSALQTETSLQAIRIITLGGDCSQRAKFEIIELLRGTNVKVTEQILYATF